MTEEKKAVALEEEQQANAGVDAAAKPIAGMSRRTFTLGCAGAAATLVLGGLKFVPAEALVRPPGGQNEDRLLGGCIRCQKCYEVCPRKAIRPARMEDGLLGMRLPEMDFDVNYCDFCAEANGGNPLCVQVCPTGALAFDKGQKPEDAILGYAELNMDWCLAYRFIGCRFCYDACIEARGEANAVIKLDELNRPVVDVKKCNGCGACESVCVSMKEGSISAGANRRAIIVKSAEAYAASKVNRAAM